MPAYENIFESFVSGQPGIVAGRDDSICGCRSGFFHIYPKVNYRVLSTCRARRERRGRSNAYSLTDFRGEAFGRVLIPGNIAVLDLGELYNYPLKNPGFNKIYVSRVDGRHLSRKDLAHLEMEITYDLRFDYSEGEVDIDFDERSILRCVNGTRFRLSELAPRRRRSGGRWVSW